MKYSEIKQDLFKMSDDYALAHCISADAEMGKGIAVEFAKRFDLQQTRVIASQKLLFVGSTYPDGRVFNLVTKQKYWEKPTLETMKLALLDLRRILLELGITKIAMPRIGAGLDKLPWIKVRNLMISIFAKTNIEIVVCYIK